MSDVSVIGTGTMGSALVKAFATSGATVTAWNRTPEKARALSGPGVHVAESVAEALRASPLTILSVSDQAIARSLVEDSGEGLEQKVVASASFVTPDQGRAFGAAVSAAGGHYLDLSIPAYPSEVRSGAAVFIISGERAAYEAHRARFETIGRATYVGGAPAAAFISEMAVLLAYLPMAIGLLQGRRMCEQQGIPLEWFDETVHELYPFHIRSLLERVNKEPDASQRSVEASVNEWGKTAGEYADYLREVHLDATVYDALHRMFAKATEAGYGEADWTGIVEHTTERAP